MRPALTTVADEYGYVTCVDTHAGPHICAIVDTPEDGRDPRRGGEATPPGSPSRSASPIRLTRWKPPGRFCNGAEEHAERAGTYELVSAPTVASSAGASAGASAIPGTVAWAPFLR